MGGEDVERLRATESPVGYAAMGEGAPSVSREVVLGNGGFGKVVCRGASARKIYKCHEKEDGVPYSTLREVVALQHCGSHESLRPHVIEMTHHALREFYMEMPMATKSLRDVFRAGPLPPASIQHYALRMWEALMHLHAAGVVHRDFKPDNVLLFPNPKLGCDLFDIRVADFGASKIVTTVGYLHETDVCTYVYASNELLRGKPYDHRCDLWSLGIMLAEAKLGSIPFQGSTNPKYIVRMHADDNYMQRLVVALVDEWKFLLQSKPEDRTSTKHKCVDFVPFRCREEDHSEWPECTLTERPKLRDLIIDWIDDVFRTYGVNRCCFPLTISLLDRCIVAFSPTESGLIRCYTIVAIFIVTKIFDDDLIELRDLRRDSDCNMDVDAILAVEHDVLDKFGSDLLVKPLRESAVVSIS